MASGPVVRFLRAARRRLYPVPPYPDVLWEGDFSQWKDASARASGYDSPLILEKVCQAIRTVKAGRAAFERDSVMFETEDFNWPLVAQLLRIATASGEHLRVLDFGGSLGSTWFQNRRILAGLAEVRWNVVEQPSFVAAGRKEFEDEFLRFFATAAESAASCPPDVVLASNVVQYLPDPFRSLRDLAAVNAPFLLLDRTATLSAGRARLTLQTTPEWIYPAAYPAWFLPWHDIVKAVEPSYTLDSSFASTIDSPRALRDGVRVEWRGGLFQRRPAQT
jgi:putative methyltransferase (TIGR04325 family)